MADQKAVNKTREKIKKDLFSGDDKVVLAAVKKTSKNGDASFIHPLLIAYRDAGEGKIRDEIGKMLRELKISEGEDILLEALKGEEFPGMEGDLMSFIWNSGFQTVDDLEVIVDKALKGDYMCAVEGLTLLESLGGPVNEESLHQALIDVRTFLMEHKDTDHQNFPIALGIYEVLSKFEE